MCYLRNIVELQSTDQKKNFFLKKMVTLVKIDISSHQNSYKYNTLLRGLEEVGRCDFEIWVSCG